MRALRLPASEIDSLIERWTSVIAAEDIMMRLQGRGVEAAIVQGARQLLESDPHLHERGYFQPFRHFPSDRMLLTDAMQYRLSDFPRTVASGPPQLGEANDYVFRDLLRLREDEIQRFTAVDVIGTAALSKVANGKNGQ
jgi:formyl-CoA transferase